MFTSRAVVYQVKCDFNSWSCVDSQDALRSLGNSSGFSCFQSVNPGFLHHLKAVVALFITSSGKYEEEATG